MDIQRSFKEQVGKGILYLVGTPIGNLNDMTYRAVQILQEVDLIAAEDTRHTIKLLNHFQITKHLVSYHEHNKEASGKELLKKLVEGQTIALVSDAGMPAISDPGYELVAGAIHLNITVVPVPGANAGLLGLIASGLPTKRFMFVGFLSREKKLQKKELGGLKEYKDTLIIYEAPHRIRKTLISMKEELGERKGVLIRELTKKYEEFIRGTLTEIINHLEENPAKGELTLILEGNQVQSNDIDQAWWNSLSIIDHIEHYIQQGKSVKESIKMVATERQLPKRDVYREYHGILSK